jgi:hypothetical protein
MMLSGFAQDLPVHLSKPLLSACLGDRDQLQQLLTLVTMLGKELRGGEEHRAGQAGVGVRAALLHRQSAVAVRQGLGGAAEPLLGPGGVGERTAWSKVTVAPWMSTLRAGLPLAAQRWCRAGGQEVVRRILDQDSTQMTGHYAPLTLDGPAKTAGGACLPIIAVKSEAK